MKEQSSKDEEIVSIVIAATCATAVDGNPANVPSSVGFNHLDQKQKAELQLCAALFSDVLEEALKLKIARCWLVERLFIRTLYIEYDETHYFRKRRTGTPCSHGWDRSSVLTPYDASSPNLISLS